MLAEIAMNKTGWSRQPGSCGRPDARHSDCFTPRPSVCSSSPSALEIQFRLARFAFDGAVLASVAETLPIAESFRRALLARCRGVLRRQGPEPSGAELCARCPALSGKEPDGTPRRGHQHAF